MKTPKRRPFISSNFAPKELADEKVRFRIYRPGFRVEGVGRFLTAGRTKEKMMIRIRVDEKISSHKWLLTDYHLNEKEASFIKKITEEKCGFSCFVPEASYPWLNKT